MHTHLAYDRCMADEVQGAPGTGPKKTTPKALAFYLPQYHPIPENDEWWGKGFTEWLSVAKAAPLFPGHYQPHVPSELGYYDLRLPEVRAAQADLAREHGIHGFVYYHYWFNGRRLLERPFEEVLASGEPDFPFALCWANEEWTRNWDAQTGTVLMPQEFSEVDDRNHIAYLLTAFADDRYIKVDGRPMMLVYRPQQLPDPERTFSIWREEAKKAGFPDLYLVYVESWGPPPGGPQAFGMDASTGFMPVTGDQVFAPVEGTRGHRLIDYWSSVEKQMKRRRPRDYRRFPSVMVSWDNTPRRKRGATIFSDVTPEKYRHWLDWTVTTVADVPEEENFLFIVAWNEWAEGNHLEPDERYGRAWLEATRDVLVDGPPGGGAVVAELRERNARLKAEAEGTAEPSDESGYDYIYDYQYESAVANAAGLVRDLVHDRSTTIVDLGAGSGIVSHALAPLGIGYHGLELHPVAVEHMRRDGIAATQCDLSDTDSVRGALDGIDDVGGFLLLDVLEHLYDPQALLGTLSEWALAHGSPPLIVSVPNVAHYDVALRLLCGRWIPKSTGLLDSTHIRFFTAETLENMLVRTGWEVVARDDFSTIRSDQYDPDLDDALPPEMVGALRTLAAAENPAASVQQYVWALQPVPVERRPQSYLEAVELTPAQAAAGPRSDMRAVADYLASAGMLASEAARRAVQSSYGHRGRAGSQDRDTIGDLKAGAVRVLYSNPKVGRAFRKLYYRVR